MRMSESENEDEKKKKNKYKNKTKKRGGKQRLELLIKFIKQNITNIIK